MTQSLSRVLLHLVFRTKGKAQIIDEPIQPKLWAYLASACKGQGSPALEVGGATDHVHILCGLSRTITISKLLEEIKRTSSKWIKTQGAHYADFAWQSGYGVFSVAQSQADAVVRYIRNQETHHRKRTFQDEFRDLLRKHTIEFDERYVWD